MPNQFLLTPYLLHQHAPALSRMAGGDWKRNEPTLAGNAQTDRMIVLHRQIATFVSDTFRRGNRPVSVSGDCCSAIAVLAGLQHAGLDPAVVWLDAHGDFNTRETTVTGFLGGMPLAMMTGRGDQTFINAASCRCVADQHVVLTDGRDLDPAEAELLRASAVRHVADSSAVVDALPPDRPLLIHFDTDFLNPLDAPAMQYRTAGGPRLADALALAAGLARTDRIAAVSVTAWDLDGDADRTTELACLQVLDSLLSGGLPSAARPAAGESSRGVGAHGG
jgi:arginase